MLGRVTQSSYQKQEALIYIYTDGLCICVRGDRAQRDNLVSMTVVLWRCLGFPQSWAKGARGAKADWIGANFDIANHPRQDVRGIS